MYEFDTYTRSVDHASDRWAASDRGWLTVDGLMRGNYLEYLPVRGYRDSAQIHAVVFDAVLPAGCDDPQFAQHCHYRYQWFETIAEAQAWMVAEVTGQLFLPLVA